MSFSSIFRSGLLTVSLAPFLTITGNAAIMITTADGNGADTFVRDGNATTNFGADQTFVVKNAGSAGTNRVGLLKFDLSTLTFAPTSTTLNLFLTNFPTNSGDPTSISYSVFGINEPNGQENFIEGDGGTNTGTTGEITYNISTAAGISNTGDNTFNEASGTNLGSFSLTNANVGSELTFSSAALNTFITDDTNGIATFAIVAINTSSGTTAFASKETTVNGRTAPALTFVPEPTSMSLFLLGAGLLLVRRRH